MICEEKKICLLKENELILICLNKSNNFDVIWYIVIKNVL